MPKRRHNDRNGKEDGRNCWTKVVSTERLEKAQKRLQCLIDLKASLEDNLEKCLIEIEAVAAKIVELECKLEKMATSFRQHECEDHMKEEILTMKENRAKAEREVIRYKMKIGTKAEKLEQCKKAFAGIGGGGSGGNGGSRGNESSEEDEC